MNTGQPMDASAAFSRPRVRFDTVLPAAGSSNSCIELTLQEMEPYAETTRWVDGELVNPVLHAVLGKIRFYALD